MSDTNKSFVFIRGRKVILRPVLEEDLSLSLKWVNDFKVIQYMGMCFPSMEAEEKEWLENLSKNQDKSKFVFTIIHSNKAIGFIGLYLINWVDRTASTWTMIGETNEWGKGYATEAKMLLLDYAFNTLNLRKISAKVSSVNYRILKQLCCCGYEVEGKLKRQKFHNGRYYDQILLAVFKRKWLPLWKTFQEKELPLR